MSKMIRNFMNWDLRNDGKNVQDVRGKINKSIVNVFFFIYDNNVA